MMAPLTLDPARTALVVIDLTKGVLSLPSVPHPVQEVLANTVRLVDAFRRTGSFVVLVNVHSVDGKDLLHPISDTGFPLPAERPKDWAELAPELRSHPKDHLITKHQWGAFNGVPLFEGPLQIWSADSLASFPLIGENDIVHTTRIGIGKAKELPLRFYLRGNRSISRP